MESDGDSARRRAVAGGEGRATFVWHDSGVHLVEPATVDAPEAPDGVSIIGCDAANGTYYQLYSQLQTPSRTRSSSPPR